MSVYKRVYTLHIVKLIAHILYTSSHLEYDHDVSAFAGGRLLSRAQLVFILMCSKKNSLGLPDKGRDKVYM